MTMKETQETYVTKDFFVEAIRGLEERFTTSMDEGFSKMKEGFEIVFDRFEKIDRRFDEMDQKIDDLAMTKVDKEEFLPLYKRVVKLEKKAA